MSEDTLLVPLPWLRDKLEARLMDAVMDDAGRLRLDVLSSELLALIYVGVQLRILEAKID